MNDHAFPPKPRFYIVNTFDRPSEDMIVELKDDGWFYYIHPRLREEWKDKPMATFDATPLEAFGLSINIEGNVLEGVMDSKLVPTAAYPDGRPRRWQGSSVFAFPYFGFSLPKPSDTPRCDASDLDPDNFAWGSKPSDFISITLGRELEQELNEARALNRECIKQLMEARAALKACVEDSIELLGERGWWKDEPRAGFSQRYADTQENIERARAVLDLALRAGEVGINSQTTNNQ